MRAILFFLCMLVCVTVNAQLSGIYTIDPSKAADSTNYQSIKAAVEDLTLGTRSDSATANGPGVSDSVTFLIADGTYKTQLYINSISGTSDTTPVIFTSASGDSSKVILTYPTSSSSSNNFLLNLTYASDLIFSDLTFQRTGSDYYSVILYMYGSNNNTFTNCHFKNTYSSSSGVDASAVYMYYKGNNNIFRNLYIDSSQYGFFCNGDQYDMPEKNRIENCIFKNIGVTGIWIIYQDSVVVKNNKILNIKNEFANGISVYRCKSQQIIGNQIIIQSGGHGIDDYESTGTSAKRSFIANNMISVIGGKRAYGAYFYNTTYLDVINNSIYIGDSTGYDRIPLYFEDGSTASRHQRLFNNNIANFSGDIALYVGASSHNNFDSLGYNNYYSTGEYFAGWQYAFSLGKISSPSSSSWTSLVTDRKSIFTAPHFFSAIDLHSDAVMLNGKAKPWPILKRDIDSQLRDTKNPDIGADEFTSYGKDINIVKVSKPVPGKCEDTSNLYVTINNNGKTALSSVALAWKINGQLQDTFKKTLSLASGKDTTLNIGRIAWALNIPDTVTITVADTANKNFRNDTITVKYKKGLKGTFTLGDSSSDFRDFDSALKEMYKWGICGDVIFDIADGVYNKRLEILPITGAGKNARITFRSASKDSTKVIISKASEYGNIDSNYVIAFNGADYVGFENITIRRTGNYTYGQAVLFYNKAQNNQIKNCIISAAKSNNTYAWIMSDNGGNNDSNLIENNILRYGFGPAIFGNAPVNGNSKSYKNTFKNNTFDSLYATGLRLYNQERAQLIGNTFVSKQSGFDTAFYLKNCNNKVNISGNYINLNQGGHAILLDECTAGYYSPSLVSNNMIIIGGNTGKICYGIEMLLTTFIHIYNNTIRIDTGSHSYSADVFFGINTGTPIYPGHRIFNNILINESQGYTIWASSHTTSRKMIDSSDNNVFYSSLKKHILYDNANSNNISGWRTFSGFDSKSIFLKPTFTHKDSLFTFDYRLDGKAAPWTSVTTDIEGEKRNAIKPDIGADEFTPLKDDAYLKALISPLGIPCKGLHDLKVKVTNMGSDTLKSVLIGYKIDGVFTDTSLFKTSVASYKDTILNLGKIYMGDTVRRFAIYTSLPNGNSDQNTGNDTLNISLRSALKGNYTIGTDSGSSYKSFTNAVQHLDSFGICGPVNFQVKDGIYKEAICIKHIKGSNKTNTIIFESLSGDSSKVILYAGLPQISSDSNYVLLLDSAHDITFSKITLKRQSNISDGRAIDIRNNAARIQFLNCQLISAHYGNKFSHTINTTQDCDSIVIKNNLIKFGYNGINFKGLSQSNRIENVIIEDNIFDSIQVMNISLEHIKGLTIRRNRMLTGNLGAYLIDIDSKMSIENNQIHVKDALGIDINGAIFSKTAPGRIVNNMVIVEGKYNVTGIRITSCLYIDVLHNSVKIMSDWNESVPLSVHSYSNSYYGHRLINNVLVNTGPGHALYLRPSTAASTIPYCDYNALYTNGKYIARQDVINYATLKDWIKAMKVDSHSVNVLPVFLDTFDLHVQSSNINGKALPLTTVQKDIDNQSRSLTKPDIGADEYDPISHDLAIQSIFSTSNICGDSATYFGVVVENQGANSESNLKVNLNISGASTLSLDSVFKVTLLPAQIDTLYFSKGLNTINGGTYYLSAWLKLTGDIYAINDSAKSTIKILARQSAPVIKDTMLCAGSYLVLRPSKSSSANIIWYGSATTDSAFLVADSLVINNVYKDTTFYISAVPANGCESYRTRVKIKVNQKPANAELLKGNIFSGNFNDGSISSPDNICEGSASEYLVQTPNGFSDSSYGKDWKISSLEVRDTDSNKIFRDTSFIKPSSTNTGKIVLRPAITGNKKSLQLTISIADIKTGCDTTFERFINVIPLPEVKWGVNTICEGDEFTFLDSSMGGASYFWAFGDGNTSNDQNPKYKYTKAGKYVVKLKVTNASGCTDSLTKTVIVYPVPLVNFNIPASVCEGEIFALENLTSFKDSLKYSWKFGDNTISADSAVTHTYSTQGTYNITLTAYTSQGCSRSLSKTIAVKYAPNSSFLAPDTVCAGENIYYRNTGSSSINYLWIFSNGDTFTTRHVTQNFSKEGNYSASLIITNSNGCTDTFTQNISVLPIPKPDFEAAIVCEGDSTIFINKSNTVGQAGTKYLWRFGDGTTSTLENPNYLYSKAGYYNVSLIVTGKGRCKDSITRQIIIGGKPKVALKTNDGCLGNIFSFTDMSQPTTGKIVSRSWDFGNGNTSADSVAQYKFSKAGKYAISLQVRTEFGCTETLVDTVEVFDLPVANFAADTVCTGHATSFTNKSTGNYAQLWYFGDGDSSFSSAPKHTYKASGNYDVVLLVASIKGCTDTFKQKIRVLDIPSAAFSFTAGSGGAVSFIPDNLNYSSYKWYFGDGNTSDSASATHVYGADGVYTVSLVTTNSNGCIDSVTKQVTIKTLGIEKTANNLNAIEVFPNPFHTSVTVKYSLPNAENVKIVILDIQGKEVFRKDFGKRTAGEYSETISANIAAGTYTLHMLLGEKIVARKIIKVN